MTQRIFVNRRSGKDRRSNVEQRQNPRLDLTYRRRRKNTDRRAPARKLTDDFYASGTQIKDIPTTKKH